MGSGSDGHAAAHSRPILKVPLCMADYSAPRRRFRFRLRTLLIFVMLLAIPLGWTGCQAKIVRTRRALLMHVISRGGEYFVTEMASGERVYYVVGANASLYFPVPNKVLAERDWNAEPSGIRR
jgi:hypothetical protein